MQIFSPSCGSKPERHYFMEQTTLDAIDFHYMERERREKNSKYLLLWCTEESHTDLKLHKGEQMKTVWVNRTFNK